MKRTALRLTACGAFLCACAKPGAERPPAAAGPPSSPAMAAPGVPAGPVSPASPGSPAPAPSSTPGVGAPMPATPPLSTSGVPSAPERHGPPLPELSVKSFGLHIGGSAADAAARADFLRALEAATPSYLDCYRTLEDPGSVGTFGADLTIGGAGGKPRVAKPRTKLRGEAFQACMLRALERVSFGRTPSGRSVVVSYSVKFSLSE